MTASSNNVLPDKDYLYGKFQKTADWQDKLYKKLAHKSLDIGEEEDIHVDKSNTTLGMTWKEMTVIGALFLGGFYVYNKSQQPQPQPQPTQVLPVDSEYEVRFYDAAGNPIDVKPLERK